MATTGQPGVGRSGDNSAAVLKLMMLVAAAAVLMVVDARGGWLTWFRGQSALLVEPMYRLASVPGRTAGAVRDLFVGRQALLRENRRLSTELLAVKARENRLLAVQRENQRLRALLGGTRGYRIESRLAAIMDIDLDPFRHRVVLDQGMAEGVRPGQVLIDGSGVVGQVISAAPGFATALLVSDPDHAVPVQVARSGLRLIAYGTGEIDRLRLPNIPQSGDIRVDDELVTSGIGGTFPAGFPLGRVLSVRDDPVRLFRVADVAPAAALDRIGEVLLVWNAAAKEEAPAGPPAPGSVPR